MVNYIGNFLKKAIATLTLWLIVVSPSFAFPQGMLISADNNQIDIYPQPNQEQPAIGKGDVGDNIMLLEQAYNNQGEKWDHIRLTLPPQTEGWISDSYLQREQVDELSDDPYDPKNYYQLNQFQ